jgi:hypothetical protein
MALESQQRHIFQKIDINKKRGITKTPESIRGEKGVKEDLGSAYGSVETENKNRDVLVRDLQEVTR